MFHSSASNLIQTDGDQDQGDRRKGTDRRKDSDRGSGERRKAQRRAFFRANYPKGNRLKILNTDIEVVDICENSLRFCGSDQWDRLSKIIENDEIFEVSVLFHDNTVENIKGHITKCYTDLHSKEQYYILMFEKSIPSKRISYEQSYLLKKFPEFSKQLFIKANESHE